MELDKYSYITDILSKIATETPLTAEEEIELAKWEGGSSANRRVLERIRTGASMSEFSSGSRKYDGEAAAGAIKKILHRNRRRRLTARSASAAAVVLIAASSYIMLIHNSVPAENGLAVTAPGTRVATLSVDGHGSVVLENREGLAWKEHVGTLAPDEVTEEENVTITIDVPRGSEYQLTLDDGTLIWLNSDSRIEYPARFTGGERNIRLSGEAFLDVVPDAERPFIVSAGQTDIIVRGTTFNVSAYESDLNIVTTLVTGLVDIVTPAQTVSLTPGRQARIYTETNFATVHNVNTDLYTSWLTGLFEFDGMELRDICVQLSRWYDMEFTFEGNAGRTKFTGAAWKDQPLDSFLRNIERMTDVKFTYVDGNVLVSRE